MRGKLARKAHGRVRLAVSVKATDAAGNSRTTVSKLALKAR